MSIAVGPYSCGKPCYRAKLIAQKKKAEGMAGREDYSKA